MSIEKFRMRCSEAIARIDRALARHRAGESEDLNEDILLRVRSELETMKLEESSSRFRPSFGRAILDWPDRFGLVETLLETVRAYERLP